MADARGAVTGVRRAMKNTVVVDSSLALKWIFQEADSFLADALLNDWSRKEIIILAPTLLIYEITNALYKKLRKRDISAQRAREALREIELLGIAFDFTTHFELSVRAVELSNQYSLPATYDAHFLALAEREQCELWTADTRMWNSLQGELPWVRNLNDYRPEKS